MLFLILFLIISTPLVASTYSSNSIGQIKAETASLSGSGYELEIEGDVTKLFFDGELIQTTVVEDNLKTISTVDSTEIYKSEDGKCISLTVLEGDTKTETFYEWDGDILVRKRTVIDGILNSIITYFVSDGDLLGYQEVLQEETKITLVNNKTIGYTTEDLTKGEVVNYYDNGLLFKTEFGKELNSVPIVEKVEDTLVFTDKKDTETVRTVYDSRGLITEKENISDEVLLKKANYSYTETGVITEEVVIEGNKKVISSYTGGKLSSIATYIEDELFSVRYLGDEIYEIRYKKGKPFARLLYDEDGQSLLEIKVL